MADITIQDELALDKFTIPAWTTADFFDAQGNLIAHFDQPRPYAKTGPLTKLNVHEFPLKVVFKQHDQQGVINLDEGF